MSRRFGRNQRRRAREALAAAKDRVEGLGRQVSSQLEKLHRQQDALDEAKQILGHWSAALPAAWKSMPGPLRGVMADVPNRDLDGPRHGEPPLRVTLQRIPLAMLFVEAEKGTFDRNMHCVVHFEHPQRGGKALAAYGISEYVVRDTPTKLLERMIVREMAPLVVEALRRELGR